MGNNRLRSISVLALSEENIPDAMADFLNPLGATTQVGASSVGLAFGFSAVAGVVFGVYPARRAAGLDPIVALRYE